ncbi:MAG TPA: maleylacetate reductase [Bauldia sp.]|nr:maleylacetate reductase [Bauldia sp.]
MAVQPFVYESAPVRVVFGSGTIAAVAEEAGRLGVARALVLSTPQQEAVAKRLLEALGGRGAATFTGARMHTPTDVTDAAMAIVAAKRIDGTVAIGGGSTTGLGKAIGLRTGLPQIVIPTTYAGSEMTSLLGETEGGQKRTLRDPRVRPKTVIYDVELTLTLPPLLSLTSGINAMAHAVEGLYARDGNPVLSLMAEEGIRALAAALPAIVRLPADKAARSDALYGAWLCGIVLGSTSVAIHHKLCHVLGGAFDLPHAETHTVILPHAVAYNASAVPQAIARVARALGVSDAAGGLFDLARNGGAPTALRDIGMPEDGLDRAADLAVADPYWNPRPIERTAIRALLGRAWAGERPRTASGSSE